MNDRVEQRKPQHLKKVEQIFHKMVAVVAQPDLAGQDTEKMLDELCSGDTAVRDDVEKLLNISDASLGEFMQGHERSQQQTGQFPGFRIIEQIGEGGMGTVFLAEQENPRRQVALKTLRSGFPTTEIRQRFEYEAQVLGQLQHPGIAQIYSAGTTSVRNAAGWASEQPYFVMELIRGKSLTRYASGNGLTIDQRLRLVIDICQAVQSAHQRGVVHRDLKPGNILVTISGQVKILDFGVARMVEGEARNRSGVSTQLGQLVGTLAYMSPEQLTGDSTQVDTRSDVYAIGVVLFELLTGKVPYETGNDPLPVAIEKIRQQSLPRISSLNSRLRGDVQTIVEKSLEKNKSRRYQTASELAGDIDRYLNHLPIAARPASAIYQLRKLARRNVAAVVAAAVVLTTLIVAGIVVSRFAVRQSIALIEARRQNRIVDEVNSFINDDLLANANPTSRYGKDISVRELLDAAAARIDDRFEGMPLVEAAIRSTIGRAYYGVGDYFKSDEHLRVARSIYLETVGPDDERTLDVSIRLASIYTVSLWKPEEADSLLSDALHRCGTRPDDSYRLSSRCQATWAVLFRKTDKYEESEQRYRQALELSQQHDPDNTVFRRIVRNNLALLLSKVKRFEESETILRSVIEEWTAINGRNHPNTAFALLNLGDNLCLQAKQRELPENERQAKLDEAEAMFQEAMDIRSENIGEKQADTVHCMYALAMVQINRHDYETAEKTLLKTLTLRRAIFGRDEHPVVLTTMNTIATTRNALCRFDESVEMFETALEAAMQLPGQQHRVRQMILSNLLYTYRVFHQNPCGIRGLLTKYDDRLSDTQRIQVTRNLGQTLALQKAFDEAISTQHRVIAMVQATVGEDIARRAIETHRLASYLFEAGDCPAARETASQALKLYAEAPDDVGHKVARLHHLLGDIYLAEKDFGQARASCQLALQFRQTHAEPNDVNLVQSHLLMARILDAKGSPRRAEEEILRLLERPGHQPSRDEQASSVPVREQYAEFLQQHHRLAEAEQQLVANVDFLDSEQGYRSPEEKLQLEEAVNTLVMFYESNGQAELAADLLNRFE